MYYFTHFNSKNYLAHELHFNKNQISKQTICLLWTFCCKTSQVTLVKKFYCKQWVRILDSENIPKDFFIKKIAISHSKVHCRYFSKYFHMKEALQFSLQFHRCIKCDISRMGSNYVVSDQKKNNTQNLYHKIFFSFLLFTFIGLFHLVQISIPKLIWTLWESPMCSFVHWSRTINSNRLT